ncbi:hypothetical protein [Actinomadura rupiterrae]|uniref:hypothetical protein n=1 Tax=Actinomadura rupiterrae TaxID=559627 RepID=UPI0020A29419|nr:hypothetical protein [Actinomadura rupiterrae]MCP2342280.1 DNA gyrase/topoisomerase IV subunit B [Actinomadura rupiterrae]
MEYDGAAVRVVSVFEAVRGRPLLYFGVALDDPGLAGVALALAVQDALTEVGARRVRVVVEGALRFSVEDDGGGIPVEPGYRDGPPLLTMLLTTTLCGRPSVHRTGMAPVAALCTEVVAETWWDGRHYRQRVDGTGEAGALEVLEASTRQGTRVSYRLNDGLLRPGAEIPRDVGAFVEGLRGLPHQPEYVRRPGSETVIEVLDRRG